jgi:hypothetical protein
MNEWFLLIEGSSILIELSCPLPKVTPSSGRDYITIMFLLFELSP